MHKIILYLSQFLKVIILRHAITDTVFQGHFPVHVWQRFSPNDISSA